MGLIEKAKQYLGLDIKEEKYALVDDPIFGKVAKAITALTKHPNF